MSYDRNRKLILTTYDVCGICGQPVDKRLKYPHPLAPCVDHIIPIDRGGHPSDISNLQLAHWKCNRAKSNKLIYPVPGSKSAGKTSDGSVTDNSNRNLPLSMDWRAYHGQ